MAKEYKLNIVTKFKDDGETLEDIIIKILNNNIFCDAQIDFQNNIDTINIK